MNDDVTLTHQFLNAMVVDEISGNVYVCFYDRRNYASDTTDFYLAWSSDGGNTFTNEKLISSHSWWMPLLFSAITLGSLLTTMSFDLVGQHSIYSAIHLCILHWWMQPCLAFLQRIRNF
ncbi:MAG: hypothetical protein IPO39_07395 [Bacteroidetes bacterium]|nr:hypothetical protein [Bacteroidota bacterium]